MIDILTTLPSSWRVYVNSSQIVANRVNGILRKSFSEYVCWLAPKRYKRSNDVVGFHLRTNEMTINFDVLVLSWKTGLLTI